MQIFEIYQMFYILMSVLSAVLFAVGAITIFVSGTPSTPRTLICLGMGIDVLVMLTLVGATVVQRMSSNTGSQQVFFLVYGVTHLFSLIGSTFVILGIVQLIRRATHLEMLLQENDD